MWQGAKNSYHLLQGIVALLLFRFPSRKMTVIGVTGTDGKTTTASLIYHILQSAGYKTALVSSTGAIINKKTSDIGFHVTTPGRFSMQSYLRKARKAGCTHVVLEVTSHALDQHRIFGIPFTIGVVTNITKEHLDYHKTWERYVHAKAKLVRAAKIAVLNKDDRSYLRIKKQEVKSKEKQVITYGMKKDSDVNPHVFPFKTKLWGRFNEYNCLAAIAVSLQLHIPEGIIRKAVADFKAPIGRQEVIYDKAFTVINDFAHTPQAFNSVLPEIKKKISGRLIHVFGAAAKRDTYKRPEMGRISSEYADIIIVTSEDPRNEPQENISSEILSGISNTKFTMSNEIENAKLEKGKKYAFTINDRKQAIAFAISLAQKGDVVLLTGKGSEKSMNYGRGEEPWDETGIALAALREREKARHNE